MQNLPRLVTLAAAAEELGAGYSTVQRALADGRLTPATVAGRRVVVVDSAFKAFSPRETGRRTHRPQSGDAAAS
jgi:predicted site-specific integrase-resolvase